MTSSTPAITGRADVRTDAPARYAKQLVAHLSRKLDFTTHGTTSTATIGDGTGHIIAGDGVLTLLAPATTSPPSRASSRSSAATSSASGNATSSKSPGHTPWAAPTPNESDKTRRLQPTTRALTSRVPPGWVPLQHRAWRTSHGHRTIRRPCGDRRTLRRARDSEALRLVRGTGT
jgi:hypothetical protein